MTTKSPSSSGSRRRARIKSGLLDDARRLPLLLILPSFLLIATFVVYPIIYTVTLASQEYSPYLGGERTWVGAENYFRVLSDATFWHTLRVSVIWVAGSVCPQFLLGLAMALMLNETFRGRGIVRTIVLAPWAVSGVVTGIIWLWLFDGTIGVINAILVQIGLVNIPIAWGIDEWATWFMVLVANAWRGAPFFAITLLAALQTIDKQLYEAARVDGATTIQRFRYITLPLLVNTIVLTTLLRALWTFNFVDLIWTMTRGGPVDATKTLPIYIFDVAYQRGDFGYAAALSVALCLILLVFAALYWQLNRFSSRETA